MRKAALLALIAAGSGPAPARAQLVPPLDSTRFTVVLNRDSRDRWIHEDQHPGLVPRTEWAEDIQVAVTPTRFPPQGRHVRFRGRGGLEVSFSVDPWNAPVSVTVDLPSRHISRFEDEAMRAAGRRRPLEAGSALGDLPSARFWDLVPPLPGRALAPGDAWTDTLDLVDDPGEGLGQRLTGVRHSVVMGDTVLQGRTALRVRVTADVRMTARTFVPDAAMAGDFTVDRDVAGTVTGTVVVDTALGLVVGGADTTLWAGSAVLRTPEGRAYPSGVRYERFRRWSVQDSAVWAAARDSARESDLRNPRGMLIVAADSLQARLRRGDEALRDSLWGAWRRAGDPDHRREVELLLLVWDRDATRARLVEEHRALGDTGTAALAPLGDRRDALSVAEAARLLPYLGDLGTLWRRGLAPRWTYTTLAARMVSATPVLADSARWWCDPAACRLLIEAGLTSDEPRLRDVALSGAFARDPAAWFARVVARADSGSLIAATARDWGRGVGATWPAAPKDPVPGPAAGWRAWLSWMGGQIRFEGSHRSALRFYTARTGRDPVAELAQDWPPEGDSARLVVGTILREMGAQPAATADELVPEFLSGSPARVEAAQRQLFPRLGPGAPLADPALAAELLTLALQAAVTGEESPWPGVEGLRTSGGLLHRFARIPAPPAGAPAFLLDQDLPVHSGFRAPPSLQRVDSATWAAYDKRRGGVLVEVSPVRASGPFIRLSWAWTSYYRREGGDAPAGGYAGGGGLTLLHHDGRWWVVGGDAWIT